MPAPVYEFTIRVETPSGTECDAEKAAAVDEAMELSPQITRIESGHSTRSGTISSTFRVRAPNVDDAQELALRVFSRALAVARISSEHGWLVVEASGP